MYRIFILILFFIINTIKGNANEMNLKDCIAYTLQQNLTLTNKRIHENISKEEYKQSQRNLLPRIDAGGSSNILFGKSIDPTTNAFVNQQLFSMNFQLSSQLQLFNGFIRQNTIKFNKTQYLISHEDVKKLEMELSFQTMTSYFDVLYYQNLMEIVEEQLKLTELNLKKTKKLIKIGLKAQADLLEMEAQKASEIHNRLTVRNKLDNAMFTLKKTMNYPITTPLDIVADAIPIPHENIEIDTVYKKALVHMPLVKKARLSYEASKKNVALKRGQFYPSLTLGANYATNFADSRKEKLNPNLKDSPLHTIPFNDQFSQNASQSVYLHLSIPIFHKWQNRSQVKIAKLQRQIAANNKKESEATLYQQITIDHQQLQSLKKEYKQLEIKNEALLEAYKVADKKLEQGIISVLEFYTAKNQLANAKADLLRTRMQLTIKQKTINIYLNKY